MSTLRMWQGVAGSCHLEGAPAEEIFLPHPRGDERIVVGEDRRHSCSGRF
jgi:hypothetical protein